MDDIEDTNAIYRYARVVKILSSEGYYCNYEYRISLGEDD